MCLFPVPKALFFLKVRRVYREKEEACSTADMREGSVEQQHKHSEKLTLPAGGKQSIFFVICGFYLCLDHRVYKKNYM